MLAHPFSDRRWTYKDTTMIQPKLDGVRMLYDGKDFYSRNSKPIALIFNKLKDEIRDLFGDTPLDGELFLPGTSFDKISGEVRKHSGEPQIPLQYHIYDSPIIGPSFYDRYSDILFKSKRSDNIIIVETLKTNNLLKIKSLVN